jgi:hypothetical protein
MRVIAAGTFDPSFQRNQRLFALLLARGHDVIICNVGVWGANRYATVQQGKASAPGDASALADVAVFVRPFPAKRSAIRNASQLAH